MTKSSYHFKVAIVLTTAIVTMLLSMKNTKALHTSVDSSQEEIYRSEFFDIETPGSLDVITSGGFITVKGSSNNSVKVEMYVQKNGEYLSPDDETLDDWDIDISQSGNAVRAYAERNDDDWSLFGNKNRISISFVIYTPSEMSSDLKTSGGHINVQNLSGDQQISTSGGHLNLAELDGRINARTSGGHITLNGAQGEVSIKTSGGHLDVSDVTGTLNAKTSGGHISLTNVNGSVQAKTSGGNISADITSIDKFAKLKTSGGNININVPDNTGFDLDLSGSVVRSKLTNFSGETDHDDIEGKVLGGGPIISARTSGGMVSLSFQ